jgi:hypothetical protein
MDTRICKLKKQNPLIFPWLLIAFHRYTTIRFFTKIISTVYAIREDMLTMRLTIALLAASAASAFLPQTMTRVAHSTSLISPVGPATIASELCVSLLKGTEFPEKYYAPKAKEIPKVLGGLKIGLRELVVVTGASSGLGLSCAKQLAKSGKYFVVMAVRDVDKGKKGTSSVLLDYYDSIQTILRRIL